MKHREAPGSGRAPFVCSAAAVLLAATLVGCGGTASAPPSGATDSSRGDVPMAQRRPISDVLRDHTPELMAIPGVVGTAEGALASGEPCIQVLLAEKNAETEHRIPRKLEGWPVVLQVTGPIRAMPDSR